MTLTHLDLDRIDGLVGRLRATVDLADRMGASGSHLSNIWQHDMDCSTEPRGSKP